MLPLGLLVLPQILLNIVLVIRLDEAWRQVRQDIQHSPLNEVVKHCFLMLFLTVIHMFSASISDYKCNWFLFM